jgi:hypothetical protein
MKTLYLNERVDMTRPPPKRTRTYRITKAVNTVRHTIGDTLSWACVADYCDSPDWKIIITKAGV